MDYHNSFTEYELKEINRQKRKIIKELKNRRLQCKTIEQLNNLKDQLELRINELSELTNKELCFSLIFLSTLLAYSKTKEEIETEIKLRSTINLDLLDEILNP